MKLHFFMERIAKRKFDGKAYGKRQVACIHANDERHAVERLKEMKHLSKHWQEAFDKLLQGKIRIECYV